MIKKTEVQLFQFPQNRLGEEVAVVEVPGEYWEQVEQLHKAHPSIFTRECLPGCRVAKKFTRVVSIPEYLHLRQDCPTSNQAALVRKIAPFIEAALDAGYNHVVMTA